MIASLLVVLVVATIGAMAEIAARLWMRFFARTYAWKPFTHFVIRPDPKVLPRLSPVTTFRANSIGLRGREQAHGRRVFRIVTCGGSAVECFSLDETESWPHLIEKRLSEAATLNRLGVDDVHVLNLAKSGFTNEALGYMLPRVLDRVGPIDVLTITTGTSAVNAWTKGGTPPVPKPDGTAWDDIHWHSETIWGWWPPATATAAILRRWHQLWTRPVTTLSNTGGALAAGRRARQNASEVRERFPDPAAWISDYEASLSELIRCASCYAKRVVLLRQSWFDAPEPSPQELAQFWHGFVGDSPAGKRSIFYSYQAFSEMMALTDAANVRVAERFGIDTIRLADAVAPNLENYYDQIHYTPAGARCVGEFVSARLLELVDPPQQSSHSQSPLSQSSHSPSASRPAA